MSDDILPWSDLLRKNDWCTMSEYIDQLPRKRIEGKLYQFRKITSTGDYVIIGNEQYNPDQLRAFRNIWEALVEQNGHIPEVTSEQEAVARYLKLYPPSKVIDVEIDGKKYRGTVYLVEGQDG